VLSTRLSGAAGTFEPVFVLGIDPGLTRCGYGAVAREGTVLRAVAAGVLTTPASAALPARLAELQAGVRALLAELRPDAVAVERVFFQANVRTAMSVGQASGIALAEAHAAGCVVAEYTPSQVKSAVTGNGAAGKEQVQRMVQAILGLATLPAPADAADALALAVCHLAVAPLQARVEEAAR
jgi:crossover junction endodeoxyribonuclease RuvC